MKTTTATTASATNYMDLLFSEDNSWETSELDRQAATDAALALIEVALNDVESELKNVATTRKANRRAADYSPWATSVEIWAVPKLKSAAAHLTTKREEV